MIKLKRLLLKIKIFFKSKKIKKEITIVRRIERHLLYAEKYNKETEAVMIPLRVLQAKKIKTTEDLLKMLNLIEEANEFNDKAGWHLAMIDKLKKEIK